MGRWLVIVLCAGLLGCERAQPPPTVYAYRDTIWVRVKNGEVIAAGCIDSTGNYVVIE